MAELQDGYALALADTALNRILCEIGGNVVLCNLWESLARQLTIIFGLSTLGKSMDEIVAEPRRLISVFVAGALDAMAPALEDHIAHQTNTLNLRRPAAARRSETTTPTVL